MPQDTTLPFNDGSASDETEKAKAAVSAKVAAPQPSSIACGSIMRIDPSLCDVYSLNGRAGAVFDPAVDATLIASIRERGQQVPAIVRPASEAGRFELIAGTRRLGAARYLRAFDSSITLLAEIRELTDQQAWTLAEAENADRKDMSQLERARNWQQALARLFDGNQSALARALGLDKSVVSRIIALAALPDIVLDLVIRPEAVNVHFAEQLAPALANSDRRKALLGLAANLADAGVKLSPAELARRLLLTPAEAEAFRPVPIGAGRQERQALWHRKPNGSSQLTIRPIPDELSTEDRKALLKVLTARIREHIERR